MICFQFDIKVDGSFDEIKTVTSVTFWDGPSSLPANLDITLFDNDIFTPHEPNDPNVLPYPVVDDTFIENFDDDFKDKKAFGFQIIPGNLHFQHGLFVMLSYNYQIMNIIFKTLYLKHIKLQMQRMTTLHPIGWFFGLSMQTTCVSLGLILIQVLQDNGTHMS